MKIMTITCLIIAVTLAVAGRYDIAAAQTLVAGIFALLLVGNRVLDRRET